MRRWAAVCTISVWSIFGAAVTEVTAQTTPGSVAVLEFEGLSGSVAPPSLGAIIRNDLQQRLEQDGFRVLRLEVRNREEALAQARAKGARFLVGGSYSRSSARANLSLYAQIYDPDTGHLIDAYHITDEDLSLGDIELDREELRTPDPERIDRFVRRIALALRANPERRPRRANIDEHVLNTPVGGTEFPIPAESADQASEDVFKVLAADLTIASKVEGRAEKQPASVSIISRRQIRLSGARTLNEALMIFVPGFFLVEDQDDVVAAVRGFAPDSNSKILMLLNGFNMNTEWFWGPPDSILQSIDLNFIERIEVIRGPGSVTLGQGALLGVINVVTRDGSSLSGAALTGGVGGDGYSHASFQGGREGELVPELRAYAYLGTTNYAGQKLDDRGWAKDKDYEGAEGSLDLRRGRNTTEERSDSYGDAQLPLWEVPGGDVLVNTKNVATSGARLKKTDNVTGTGRIDYRGFSFTGFYADQQRDLYNFYRDRNEVQNVVRSGATKYTHDFGENLSLGLSSNYAQDDVILHSHSGLVLGGTRENRYGGALVLNVQELPAENRFALGAEFRRYDVGQSDRNGNNFILNRSDALLDTDVNSENRYVFSDSITVGSVFLEDFYSLTTSLDLFAAFRFDRHSFWGDNVSPRLGALYNPRALPELRLRASYQQGFRGAPGVAFAGGFQKDGLLRTENYDQVLFAQIPRTDRFGNADVYRNIPEAKPETIDTYELAAGYIINREWSVDGVAFYNVVRNIVDVGVIFAEPDEFTMPRIGSDEPGDWNGYFFFRNLPGEIRTGGAEFSLSYSGKYLSGSLSHALVRVLDASRELYDEFEGGMYLADDSDLHVRSYPENVSRLNVIFHPVEQLDVSVNYLYYRVWYSPFGNEVRGQHVLNAGIGYSFDEFLEVTLTGKNLLNSGELWPMNSNAGGQDNSDGTPALEEPTYWATLTYKF